MDIFIFGLAITFVNRTINEKVLCPVVSLNVCMKSLEFKKNENGMVIYYLQNFKLKSIGDLADHKRRVLT